MKRMPIRNLKSEIRNRPGAVLLVVLICLAVSSLIFGLVLRTGLTERRLVRAQERQIQAALLAESGLERAAARLAADRDYQGETWTISADQLGGFDAQVRISIETRTDRTRTVTAQADYPAEVADRARETRSQELP
jgi:type II secretory pathway component PulK